MASRGEIAAARTVPLMKSMLFVSTFLVTVIGIILFFFPAQTETLFAWTINPPLTAAFLGACYLASAPLTFLGGRERLWANARVGVTGIIVFTILTTIATFIHLDRFHLGSANLSALVMTWVWLLVYVLDPIVFSYAFLRQVGARSPDPPRVAPLATWHRLVLIALGLPAVAVGLWMFVAPGSAMLVWPWELTPLTCRAAGAWAVGIGIVMLQAAWENDWVRLRGLAVSHVLLGLLQLANLARFSGTVNWGRAGTSVLVVFLVAVTILGAIGWQRSRRAVPVVSPESA